MLLLAALFVFVAVKWNFFSAWLGTVKHAEGPGWKVDREVDQNIDNLFGPQNNVHRDGDPHSVRAAVQYAELVGRAIQGARIIWVDPHPDNNRYERRILEDMGVSVQLAWSTEEALRLLAVKDFSPDLVISNMKRTEETTTPLRTCPGVYYDFPDDEGIRDTYKNDIWQFNAFEQTSPPAGFAMAELMAKAFPGLFGDHQRPRIIFYTNKSGGKAADACARIITNRPDVLIENVVSALVALRSALLPAPTASLPKP